VTDGAPADAAEPGGAEPSGAEPSGEQRAERRRRADRATRGALAAVLCLEALCLLLVPRAIAQTSVGLDGVKTTLLLGGAVLFVIVGFCLRRRWGIGAGSGLQLAVLAVCLWVPAFLVVAGLFLGVWVYLLHLRHELAETPGGLRMLFS
jgi:hypothetical protein